jgi:hypothetical protein
LLSFFPFSSLVISAKEVTMPKQSGSENDELEMVLHQRYVKTHEDYFPGMFRCLLPLLVAHLLVLIVFCCLPT